MILELKNLGQERTPESNQFKEGFNLFHEVSGFLDLEMHLLKLLIIIFWQRRIVPTTRWFATSSGSRSPSC